MAHKIAAPAGAILHGPFRLHNSLGLYWVHGVMYIDLDTQPDVKAVLGYFTRRGGYEITKVDTIPAAYKAAVASLSTQAHDHVHSAVAMQDGAEPGRLNYPPAA